jgi:hypothetical protein
VVERAHAEWFHGQQRVLVEVRAVVGTMPPVQPNRHHRAHGPKLVFLCPLVRLPEVPVSLTGGDGARAGPRIEPISHSAEGFCQGLCGAVRISSIPMPFTRCPKLLAVDTITVAHEIGRRGVVREGIHDLLSSPVGGRLGHDGTRHALKLFQVAEGHWRSLDAAELVPLVRAGVGFEDGVQRAAEEAEEDCGLISLNPQLSTRPLSDLAPGSATLGGADGESVSVQLSPDSLACPSKEESWKSPRQQ